jgi:hypothetical protein
LGAKHAVMRRLIQQVGCAIPVGRIKRIWKEPGCTDIIANKQSGVKPIPDVCGIWIIDGYGQLRFLTMSKKRHHQKGDCDQSEDKYGGDASHGAPPLVSTRI